MAGFLRFGFIANYVSQPILTGYMAGVAFLVIGGQLGRLFGFKVQADTFFPQVLEVARRWQETHWLTLIIGILSVVLLFWLKHRRPRLPSALLLMVAAILISSVLGLAARGVAVVGTIPSGLPQRHLAAVYGQ